MAIFGRKVMNNRITILGIVVLFLLSLDVARIFYLQVLKGDEYAAKAESQQLSDTEIPAMRGTIYDTVIFWPSPLRYGPCIWIR